MVGRLDLQSGDDPLDIRCKAERTLDSPDSGLPPSPSPTSWLLSPIGDDKGACSPVSEHDGGGITGPVLPGSFPRFHQLSYGEGVELQPLPPTEVRYTSSVRYASDRHFIQGVYLQPRGLEVESCSQTVLALAGSTWRRYRTHLELLPRHRPLSHTSTAIVFPKHAHTACRTQLLHHDGGRKSACRFLSSVELEPREGGANC
ncbi:refilin-B-like [Anguilla anguilla]|uniref:refilin-B-like n=1 Tax=Anguilla anguilla TaxID=7936 RepID=UPI0015A8A575|nr:refilin-B-like [Anguilla anguilla]